MSIAGILDAVGLLHLPWQAQLAVLLVFFGYALFISHMLKKRINEFSLMLESMTEADFSRQVSTVGNTWVSKLASDIKKMQVQMGAAYEANPAQLNYNLRLTTALDNASTSVMVLNRANLIIFTNQSLQSLFSRNIDAFHS